MLMPSHNYGTLRLGNDDNDGSKSPFIIIFRLLWEKHVMWIVHSSGWHGTRNEVHDRTYLQQEQGIVLQAVEQLQYRELGLSCQFNPSVWHPYALLLYGTVSVLYKMKFGSRFNWKQACCSYK